MSHPDAPKSLDALNQFQFDRIINEDPITHSLVLLGTFPSGDPNGARVLGIVRIEKTALDPGSAKDLLKNLLQKVHLEESTDIYTTLFAWLREERGRDMKINIICPATDVHVRKYTKQELVMVKETPEMYERIVKPYILASPASRTQWFGREHPIGLSEQSKILYSCPEFLIIPDMKWDLTTVSSLYLIALVQDRSIRSLRDLRRKHVGLLTSIQREADRVVLEKWGIHQGGLRLYIHYQPSYYHFHVHIVNANQVGMLGMMVGQAHLFDDVISLLELEPENGPGTFERVSLTYGLGIQHALLEAFRAEGNINRG
ncbi:scavenger mRNA decapping enzyme [Infundibulicybe gibba]|nr:scavenger mRNA decapping enzyme [Infundibulicybe gibba]